MMIDYFLDSSAVSDILQLSTGLLGTAVSVAAIVYTLLLAFGTQGVADGSSMLKNYELRGLIRWTVVASVLEMLSVLLAVFWSILIRVDTYVAPFTFVITGSLSISFLVLGLILIFIGLLGILKQIKLHR